MNYSIISFIQLKKDTWALYGPYLNQFVTYESESEARIYLDVITQKLARVVLSTFGGTGSATGVHILRGYRSVLDSKNREDSILLVNEGDQAIDKDIKCDFVDQNVQKVAEEEVGEEEEEEESNIQVLVLAIHGFLILSNHHNYHSLNRIGQKIGEKTDMVNFIHGTTFWNFK